MRQRMKTKNGKVLMTASLLLLDQLAIVGEELQVLQVVLLGKECLNCNSITYVRCAIVISRNASQLLFAPMLASIFST